MIIIIILLLLLLEGNAGWQLYAFSIVQSCLPNSPCNDFFALFKFSLCPSGTSGEARQDSDFLALSHVIQLSCLGDLIMPFSPSK